MTQNLKFSHKILLAASLVVIAAFSLFTLYNDYLQRNATHDNLQSYLHEMGKLAASNVENWLSGRILLVENTAQAITRDSNEDALDKILSRKALASTFISTYLGTTDGKMISRPDLALPADYDPRTRPWYKAAQAAGNTTLTDPYADASTGQLIMTIATPNKDVGVVAGDLALDTVVQIINSLDFGGMGFALLVSGDGTVLVHPKKQLIGKTLKEIYPQDTPSMDGQMHEAVLEGVPRILAFTQVQGLPTVKWYIGLSVEKDKAYAMLSKFRTSAIIVTIISVVAIIGLLGLLIQVLMQPLINMGRAMRDIARDIAQGEGDLTQRLKVVSKDEFGELASSFNQFVERIHGSMREVASATRQVHEVSQLVVNASNSSMANSDEQASRTNSVAAAINELGAAAQEIARNAADASHQASNAREQAEDGGRVLQKTIGAMNALSDKISASCGNIESLNSKTVDIGQILEVIKGISEQTNLLALNAAIEAARAGEAGRGFAVVADEVRNLAHRTQASAQEIQQMIEALQVGSREAVNTMTESQRYSQESVTIANQAGERLGSVTGRIGEIDGMNQSVATATEEQTSVIEALNMDITEINTLNQEGVENLQATLRACTDLDSQVSRLRQLVGSFRI